MLLYSWSTIYYLLLTCYLTIQRTTRCPRQLAHASRSTLSFYSSLSLPLWDYLPPQELLSSVLAIQTRVLKYAVPSISSMEHQQYFSQVGVLSLKNCLSYYCSFTTPEWGWPWWSHLSRPRPYVSPVRGKCACWPVLSSSLTEANGWQLHRITSCPNNLIFCPLPSRLRYSLIHASLASGNLPQKRWGKISPAPFVLLADNMLYRGPVELHTPQESLKSPSQGRVVRIREYLD